MDRVPLVLLGGGAAASKLVQSYRTAGGARAVVVVSDEAVAPYHRPLLTKFCVGDTYAPEEICALPTAAYLDWNIDLRLDVSALAIEPRHHRVTLSQGAPIRYGTLVVATGAVPRLPPIRGAALAGVSTFRTYADACALRQDRSERVVVVGGGFLGCELAASLRTSGRHVTLVERSAGLLPRLRCPELSEQLTAHFRRNGVDVLLGDTVVEAHGRRGAFTGALTAAGTRLVASQLVFAIGVDPNNALLHAAGAEIVGDVCVDERLATSLPDVYAIGDVCGLASSGHWSTAAEHGAALGRRLAGDTTECAADVVLPGFHLRFFDVRLHAIGDFTCAVDDARLIGSITQRTLLAVLRRGGAVVAGVAMGQKPSALDALRRWIRAGAGANPVSVATGEAGAVLTAAGADPVSVATGEAGAVLTAA